MQNIKSRFAAAGISPYDRDRVLSMLHIDQALVLSVDETQLQCMANAASPSFIRQQESPAGSGDLAPSLCLVCLIQFVLHRKTPSLRNSIQRASHALVEILSFI
ncbi:hypothetical protein BDW66DRAFT_126263 [Aspergillus desertorum]